MLLDAVSSESIHSACRRGAITIFIGGLSVAEVDGVPASRPVVVVEWNTAGHHTIYLRLYTRALLRLGRRLIVVTREPAELIRWWTESGLDSRQLGLAVVRGMPPVNFSLRRTPLRQAFRRWRFRQSLVEEVRDGERALGVRAAGVFFSCLYEHEVSLVVPLIRSFRLPWAGLYLQASAYRQPERPVLGANRDYPIHRLWGQPGLVGLLTLDEGMAARIAADCGRPVFVAPDLTDGVLGEPDDFSRRLREFKRDRALAGLCGHLLPSKGVIVFAKAALAAERNALPLCFLFAGEIAWKLFAPDEVAILRAAFALTDRVLAPDARIPTEGGYNRTIATCDVLCAAYRDFPHSSNTLTKAATFENPVIVSDGHLMAERVREYRLGEVVPQDDPGALLEAINRIASDVGAWKEAKRPRWQDYRETHSEARLAEVLRELFP